MKQNIQKILFLVVSALLRFAGTLILFGFPLIALRISFQAFIIVIGAFVIAFLLYNFLIHRKGWFRGQRALILCGLALWYLAIITLSRFNMVVLLPVLAFLVALGRSFVEDGLYVLEYREKNSLLTDWKFLDQPIRRFLEIMAPLIAANLWIGHNEGVLINYFSIVISAAVLLYLIGLRSLPGSGAVTVDKSKIQSHIILLSLVEGLFFWGLASEIIIYGYPLSPALPLILFLAPAFLFSVLKNVFRLSIWRIRPLFEYLMLAVLTILIGMFRSSEWGLAFMLMLGVLVAIAKLADRYENYRELRQRKYDQAYAIGFLLAGIAVGLSVLYSAYGYAWLLVSALAMLQAIRASKKSPFPV